jgi:hypothetical protein
VTAWTPPAQPVDNPLPPMVVSPYARSYARRHATAHMYYTVIIERMAEGVFNEGSGMVTPAVKRTIYSGPARIWTVSGPQVLSVGEEQLSFTQTNMSIPWNAVPVPHRDDLATVIDFNPHTGFGDAELLWKTFRVLDVQLGGQMFATRRMSVLAISESAAWGSDSLQ